MTCTPRCGERAGSTRPTSFAVSKITTLCLGWWRWPWASRSRRKRRLHGDAGLRDRRLGQLPVLSCRCCGRTARPRCGHRGFVGVVMAVVLTIGRPASGSRDRQSKGSPGSRTTRRDLSIRRRPDIWIVSLLTAAGARHRIVPASWPSRWFETGIGASGSSGTKLPRGHSRDCRLRSAVRFHFRRVRERAINPERSARCCRCDSARARHLRAQPLVS